MTNVASGFTLIELLVVVLIIGILAAVALPQYQKAVEKSRVAGVWSVMGSLKKAAEVYVIDGNSWVNPEELDIDIDTLYCSAERCTVTCPSSGWSNCYYLISKDGQRTCGEESWTSVSGIGVSFGFSKDNQEMELLLNDKGQFCIGSLCQLFGFQPLAQTRPSCQRPSRP